MEALFRYNWMVRKEWYEWCEDIPEEELLAERTGGVGGILHTLFHIIDVEWSWIRLLQGLPDFQEKFEEYNSLAKVKELDAKFHLEVSAFVGNWNDSLEQNLLYDTTPDGREVIDTWGEIMRHAIVHEVHHIGQLSVWARELNKKPISANFIGRGLIPSEQVLTNE
ncbi:DinB family protein [Cytobacillus purgationiresistens]|uniref:Damage-inducible protein DinB n=1 Tax=Cytobacillus purgationiresistens TaxID=863449 RepID=A0ABU0AP81_9BACI|nr:DinB family protein [Cytobacillus purgationiresistens]MDQ0272835.1 putative damage-inducible protein DinB [Cytobacillus purgationiresistens]